MGKLILKTEQLDVLNVSNWLKFITERRFIPFSDPFSKISSLSTTSSLIQNHLIPCIGILNS